MKINGKKAQTGIRGVKVTRSYLSHELTYSNGSKEQARILTVRMNQDQAMRLRKECVELMKANKLPTPEGTHLLSFKNAKTYLDRDAKTLTNVIGPDGKPMYDLTIKIKHYTNKFGQEVSAAERVGQIQIYNTDNTPVRLEDEAGQELSGYTIDLNVTLAIYSSPKKDGSGGTENGVTCYLNQIRIDSRPVRGFMEFDGLDDMSHGFSDDPDGIPFPDEDDIPPTGESVPELDLPFEIRD